MYTAVLIGVASRKHKEIDLPTLAAAKSYLLQHLAGAQPKGQPGWIMRNGRFLPAQYEVWHMRPDRTPWFGSGPKGLFVRNRRTGTLSNRPVAVRKVS